MQRLISQLSVITELFYSIFNKAFHYLDYMLNEPNLFWKNFRLGAELQISGSFIYNAIFTLENMQTFYYEEECFEFLYNISVGLERLQKIVIILLEHNEEQSQEDFEKSLITHNQLELLNRIKKKRKLNTVSSP